MIDHLVHLKDDLRPAHLVDQVVAPLARVARLEFARVGPDVPHQVPAGADLEWKALDAGEAGVEKVMVLQD